MADVRIAIGLMSGSSLDGVDVALIETDGVRIFGFGPARTFPYREEDRAIFRQAARDARTLRGAARPGAFAKAEELVTLRHAEAVETFLTEERIAPAAVNVVGFHGQTVLRDTAEAPAVQIGDGRRLGNRLGIPVVWDFAAVDRAAGGQGAPLAPVFYRALAQAAGLGPPTLFLNLGGVANVTYIGAKGELIAFDTGPGTGLVDDWIFERVAKPLDAEGWLAASRRVSAALLAELLAHPYFQRRPPKSWDRNAFSISRLAHLSDADGEATLLQFSALSVTAAMRHFPEPPRACFAGGGGRDNAALMLALRAALNPIPLHPLEALGFDGHATEAQAFAFLAVRSVEGMPLSYPLTTGVQEPLSGGFLSVPNGTAKRLSGQHPPTI